MTFRNTELPGVIVFEPKVHRDERGYFLETFQAGRYAEAGLNEPFLQDNMSFSGRGVLRGLHFQNPRAQGKLVSVARGQVLDVAVDIRAGSPTFSRWIAEMLTEENHRQLYIPPGFAHGFLVLSDTAIVTYKCTDTYDGPSEGAIRWNDPDIGIEWPISDPILGPRDAAAPLLRELPIEKIRF